MTQLANKNVSVLPPNLELARRVVAKTWFCLFILTTVPFFVCGYPLLTRIFHPEWNVLVNAALELALIGAYSFCTLSLINIYIQRLSRKVGYICPHCKNGLFQIFPKMSKVEITGQCPSCDAVVVPNLGNKLAGSLQTEEKKSQKKIRILQIAGPILILVGLVMRYGITTNSPETHAIELLNKKQYDQAIAEIDKELQDNPKNVIAWTIEGNIYSEMQKYDQALKDYNQALSLNPNNLEALDRRCMVYVAMEAYDPAIADCTHGLEINPKVAGAFVGRGMAYEAENRHDLALKDLSEAIQLIPDREILYTLRGMTYSNKGKLDDARKDFNKAQTLDPNAPELLLGRGMLNVLQGFYGDAIMDLDRVVQKTPVEPYALIWLHLAKLHIQQDDRQELEQKIAAVKDNNKWPSSVAALYAGHATTEAVRAQAATGSPSLREEQACEAEYYIGEYYLQHHDVENAKAALKSAIDSCPQAMSNEKQAAIAEFKAQGF